MKKQFILSVLLALSFCAYSQTAMDYFNKGIINVEIFKGYRQLSIKFNLNNNYLLLSIKIFDKLYQKLFDKYQLSTKIKINNQDYNLNRFHTLLICLFIRYKCFKQIS